MIDVTADWWYAIIVSSICGAVGGVAYELLQARFGGADVADAGMIEWFSKKEHGSRTYFDLGILASILIGAIAATAFLYFIPPTDVLDANGAIKTRTYDPFRLVPGALIVGSAGGAFLTAMQERLKRVVSETSRKDAEKILKNAGAVGAGGDGGSGGGDDEPTPASAGGGGGGGIDPAAVRAALDVLGD